LENDAIINFDAKLLFNP